MTCNDAGAPVFQVTARHGSVTGFYGSGHPERRSSPTTPRPGVAAQPGCGDADAEPDCLASWSTIPAAGEPTNVR